LIDAYRSSFQVSGTPATHQWVQSMPWKPLWELGCPSFLNSERAVMLRNSIGLVTFCNTFCNTYDAGGNPCEDDVPLIGVVSFAQFVTPGSFHCVPLFLYAQIKIIRETLQPYIICHANLYQTSISCCLFFKLWICCDFSFFKKNCHMRLRSILKNLEWTPWKVLLQYKKVVALSEKTLFRLFLIFHRIGKCFLESFKIVAFLRLTLNFKAKTIN